MKARMTNPIMLVPDAMQAAQALVATARKGDVPAKTLELMHLRASQINSCSLCVDMHARGLRQHGETEERLFAVATWRDTPFFTDAERAALALTEAATRLSDRSDPVPDEIWDEAKKHYDEPQLATLVLNIAIINFWNRLNVTTRQIAGEWTKSDEGQKWLKEHAVAQ